MPTKLPVSIHLRLTKNGQTVYRATLHKKSRILRVIQVVNFDSAYIKVTYDRRRGYHNSGTYYNQTDAIEWLNKFCEASLIEYAQAGV